MGYHDASRHLISNCVTLSPSINITNGSSTSIGRIKGSAGPWMGIRSTGLQDNYALSTMTVMGQIISSGTLTNNHGANVETITVKTTTFWSDTIKWDSDVWSFVNGKLPILNNIRGDQLSNNPPEHLK